MTAGAAVHSVSVAAVIVDEQQRVLLIERADTGDWQIPGGVLEVDEDVITGLQREVHEEVGLTVRPVRLTGIYKHMRAAIVALVFRCDVEPGQPELGEEVADFTWADDDQVRQLMAPNFAVRITDAVQVDGPPAVRAHDGHTVIPAPA